MGELREQQNEEPHKFHLLSDIIGMHLLWFVPHDSFHSNLSDILVMNNFIICGFLWSYVSTWPSSLTSLLIINNFTLLCVLHTRRWVDNTVMDIGEIGWDGIDWIDLAQDRDQWGSLVNKVMNLQFHKMLGSFWVAAQFAVSQERLSSMSEWVSYLHMLTELHMLQL
jgi:hypothetical protein